MKNKKKSLTRSWGFQVFGYYIIVAKVLLNNLEWAGGLFHLRPLYQGCIFFLRSRDHRYLMLVGRYQEGGSDAQDQLKKRVEKIISAILVKMAQQHRHLPFRSIDWIFNHLDGETDRRFIQALIIIQLHSKALTGGLNWTIDVPNQLQHIYTGWGHWSQLVNQSEQELDQAVALKKLKFAARECQTQAELIIIQTLMDDLAQYLVELGIEPIGKR
jgi:hypothetical protein